MQPSRASRHAIIEIDINEVAQGSDTPRTSSRQSSARTSQQRQGSLDQRAARQRTRATEHGSLNSGSLDPHVSTQPIVCWDRFTRPWVTRPARCQARSEICRASVTRLGVTQPTRISARITRSTSCCDRITRPWVTRPARCQSKDQRIERVNSSAGTGSSGRR